MDLVKSSWAKIGAAIIGIFVLFLLFVGNGNSAKLPSISKDKWQAVFLTDGQTYFGKLKDYNDSFVSLQNVYYLKFADKLQQGSSTTASSLNLIKLGGEAHGPESEMFIAKDKILFFENLKDDSLVVKAIKNNAE